MVAGAQARDASRDGAITNRVGAPVVHHRGGHRALVELPSTTTRWITVNGVVSLVKKEGLSLTGAGGLLKQLTTTVLESARNEQTTEHLGCEKHDPAGDGATQWQPSKTVLAEASSAGMFTRG